MSEVYNRAISTLARLGGGDFWNLSADERLAVAAYATLFSMTWQEADVTTKVTTQAERDHIRLTHTPPGNWWIWIGQSAQDLAEKDIAFHRAIGWLGSEEHNNRVFLQHCFTMNFGRLLIHLTSTPEGTAFSGLRYGLTYPFRLSRIWPANTNTINKPIAPFTYNEAHGLMDFFFSKGQDFIQIAPTL